MNKTFDITFLVSKADPKQGIVKFRKSYANFDMYLLEISLVILIFMSFLDKIKRVFKDERDWKTWKIF